MNRLLLSVIIWMVAVLQTKADGPELTTQLIGYTELQTNLPGGRHENIRTMRAVVMRTDGSHWRTVADKLIDDPNAWTQFAGWSPDGKQAIISRGWQNPENASWEEKHKQFHMVPGQWQLDSCLVDTATGVVSNLTAVDRVSHYNGGLFFLPDGRGLGFTPLIDGVSKPFLMDLDGHNKRDVSSGETGFAYGYSASPDGKFISYHENYQIYIARADGSEKRHIKTGHPFDFAPRWSPDGAWLLFVSGEHYNCHPYIVRRDGTDLRKLADRNGYRGVVEFLDVFDFHGGSSDIPVWSMDSKSIFYTANAGNRVELFQITLDGKSTQLTHSTENTLHYHPTLSPDGSHLLFGRKQDGVRQLVLMNLADQVEQQLTTLMSGHAAMWPQWQPEVIGK